ncbi:MAG: glycerophosphodiester phosphodiesterase family protein [archaeon]
MKSIFNKKRILALFSLAIAFIPIYLIISVPAITAIQDNYIQGAHRGSSVDYIENTLEAFEAALTNNKYQYIEFDVTITSDGKLVVIHQNNLLRIPKKFMIISEHTYEEIEEAFDFEVPEYSQVMNLVAGKKPLNIEIKNHGSIEEGIEIADLIIHDCIERGILNQVLISSPCEEVLEYIEAEHPEINTGRVYWITFDSIIPYESSVEKFCQSTVADYFIIHGYNIYNYNLIKKCMPKDKGLIIWYFTDEAYIITNDCKGEFWGCS